MTLQAWIAQETNTKVSKLLGVSKGRVSHWFHFRAFPSSSIWPKILKVSKGKVSYEKSLLQYTANN